MRKLLTSPLIIVCILIGFISAFVIFLPTSAVPVTAVDFLGQATLPTGYLFQGLEVGGLSGITYDPDKNLYYAISDDRSDRAAARFFTFQINLEQDKLKTGGVLPIAVTTLLNETNQFFTKGSIDAEGIAVTNKETVYISSEGNSARLINPFIKQFSVASGKQLQSLLLPDKFLPDKSRQRGIRNNSALESLTITPNQKYLYTATENALLQDTLATVESGTPNPCRILQYNLRKRQSQPKASKEFLYFAEPLTQPVVSLLEKFTQRFRNNGLVDLIALDDHGHFLSLERSFNGLAYNIKLFKVSLEDADNIQAIDSLQRFDVSTIKPVQKQLFLDLNTLNIVLDNIEGLTLGPLLADGRRLLIVISDNNFLPAQRTQILAFGLRDGG